MSTPTPQAAQQPAPQPNYWVELLPHGDAFRVLTGVAPPGSVRYRWRFADVPRAIVLGPNGPAAVDAVVQGLWSSGSGPTLGSIAGAEVLLLGERSGYLPSFTAAGPLYVRAGLEHAKHSLLVLAFCGALASYLSTHSVQEFASTTRFAATAFLAVSLLFGLLVFLLSQQLAQAKVGEDMAKRVVEILDEHGILNRRRARSMRRISRWLYRRLGWLPGFFIAPMARTKRDSELPAAILKGSQRFVAVSIWLSRFMRLQLIFAVFAAGAFLAETLGW